MIFEEYLTILKDHSFYYEADGFSASLQINNFLRNQNFRHLVHSTPGSFSDSLESISPQSPTHLRSTLMLQSTVALLWVCQNCNIKIQTSILTIWSNKYWRTVSVT